MKTLQHMCAAILTATLLSACGGSGGGDKSTTEPAPATNTTKSIAANKSSVSSLVANSSVANSIVANSSAAKSIVANSSAAKSSVLNSTVTNSSVASSLASIGQGVSSSLSPAVTSSSANSIATSSAFNSSSTSSSVTATTPEADLDGNTMDANYLALQEHVLTNTDLMASVKATIATRDNSIVEAVTSGSSLNPENVKRVEAILSAADWEYVFPRRAPEYTYDNFLKAVAKFPALCGSYTDGRDANAICRKTLATMFAHFTQETGGHTSHWAEAEWRQGLVYVREMGWNETMLGGYNSECDPAIWQGQTWPCGKFASGEFKSYFGRGAKQLSYNYNYGPFSEAMFGDVSVLMNNPELVADTWLNLASAIFFYVYPQPPKPSMLHVVDGTWVPNAEDIANGLTSGFGVTTQIINGGVECGGSVEVQQSLNRISYYRSFAEYLQVPIAETEVLGCKGMKQFSDTGAGALNIYWEQDWSYNPSTPDNRSYACKLVGYQTPFSAFHTGDYAKCVAYHFGITVINGSDTGSTSSAVSSSANQQNTTSSAATSSQRSSIVASSTSNQTTSVSSSSNLNTPGAISIGWLADSYASSTVTLNLQWNMWWGVNGNQWMAYVDNQQVHTETLTPNGNNAQSDSVQVTVSGAGTHQLKVALCNQSGNNSACSYASVTITLGGVSSTTSSSTASSAATSSTAANTTSSTSTNTPVATYGEYNKHFKQTSGKVVVSYFVEWGIYGRDYHVQDVPASNLTHLLFGFLAICGDNPHASAGAQAAIASECANKKPFEVTLVDRFADLEKTYPGDTWSDDVSGQNYNGNFNQLRKLKQQYPHLKILPSIGGWTMSTPFYAMAKNDATRAVFVNSAIAFIKKYDFFDGIDIDWEYPVYGGTDPELSSGADRTGYTLLMRDLRAKLNELSAQTGRTYQLTSAVGAAPEKIQAVDYIQASTYMDYIFAMSYDFMGAWNMTTGHHTPLHNNKNTLTGFNSADAVENLLAAGVPSSKIVLGAAFYGRGWKGTQPGSSHAPELFPIYGTATGAATGTWEAGVYDYRDLYNRFIGPNNTGINGFTVHYDDIAEASYLWNSTTGEFISYDSPRSIKAKTDFVNTYNLGGVLSWEIDADNGHLLNAINEGLGNQQMP